MNEYDVKRLALILAIHAEIEGMKAENKRRERQNYALAYTEDEFSVKAEELRVLAHVSNDQLFH